MDKFCKTCAILNPNTLQCQLFGHPVDPEKDFCSKHTTELIQCEICKSGLPTDNAIIDMTNEIPRTVCLRCFQLLGTCHFCKHGNFCSFETGPSPLPKFITKQIRQGNAVITTQIKNPDRIRQTCQNGCPCFDSENECMKQFNTCGKCENV